MQHAFSVFDDGSLLFVQHRGTFRVSDLKTFRRALIADPAFRMPRAFIDLSGLDMIDFSAADVLGHALDVQDGYDQQPHPAKQAIYAPLESAGYPMARMFEGLAEGLPGFDVRVFFEAAEGLAWLDAAQSYQDYLGTQFWRTF